MTETDKSLVLTIKRRPNWLILPLTGLLGISTCESCNFNGRNEFDKPREHSHF